MQIILHSHQFTISEPYAPTQLLGPVEAHHLNTLRADNIRSALARRMSQEAHSPYEPIPPSELTNLQSWLRDYDSTYSLSLPPRRIPRGTTFEDELLTLAREHAFATCRHNGVEPSEITEEHLREIASLPQIQAEARRRFAARSTAAAQALADFI